MDIHKEVDGILAALGFDHTSQLVQELVAFNQSEDVRRALRAISLATERGDWLVVDGALKQLDRLAEKIGPAVMEELSPVGLRGYLLAMILSEIDGRPIEFA